MKVAIYTRISTEKQDYENQLGQLKAFCKKNDWIIHKIFAEVISGKESARPEFKKMMMEASQRKFDAIVVWALDRFTREGTMQVWNYLQKLDAYKVKFISYSEPYFNTEQEVVRDILISVMGTLAKQERIKIGERTKAGLERAKQKGIKLGRAEVPKKVKEQIVNLREQGKSFREICKEVWYWDASRNKHYVSMGFVHKTLAKFNTKKLRK